jgi:predicted phage terminase large subunit-like protein
LGQYGYAGQIGQTPTKPTGGMFDVSKLNTVYSMPQPHDIEAVIRYWDKAGTQDGGAYTAGVGMLKYRNGRFLVFNSNRGQWATHIREEKIKQTSNADLSILNYINQPPSIWLEQEPGSGGKESAEATIARLAGFSIRAEAPTGDKVYRADPFSVQVNWGNVDILHGDWNQEFIDELRFFPKGRYKDQVDAGSGAFNKLVKAKEVKVHK